MDGHYQGCSRLRGQIPGTPEIPGRTALNVSGRGGGGVFQIHRSLTLNREIKGSLLNPGLPIRFVGLLCQVGHTLACFCLKDAFSRFKENVLALCVVDLQLFGPQEKIFSGQDKALFIFIGVRVVDGNSDYFFL
ncbi:hypothetical protein TNIN_447651 [Trichonephila inaurata madagascariensis]|uniref:Uncharacterized protein n=1 Tax=Trichonephila inaurata madagascariensis TaxID=2747483 RepID=A0A8X7BWI5_9ARAC|nr:hypothetical protein TNIN_447651 [Trichonephila inaurata madagascariensis]